MFALTKNPTPTLLNFLASIDIFVHLLYNKIAKICSK